MADPDTTDNKWQSGYPEDLDKNLDSLEMGSGDDTVPFSSASSLTGVDIIESASADHTNTIDGQAVATTTIDLFDYSLGAHNLSILAIDKAGNQSQAQVNFEIIANIDSTISDIEEIHERGWLTDKIYEKLLKKMFKLLKIEAKYFGREQELNERLVKKTQDDSRLTDEQKQKLIERYDKKLLELKRNRQKAISRSLDLMVKLLNRAKDKSLLNQQGYDIMLNDVNYLRENL